MKVRVPVSGVTESASILGLVVGVVVSVSVRVRVRVPVSGVTESASILANMPSAWENSPSLIYPLSSALYTTASG